MTSAAVSAFATQAAELRHRVFGQALTLEGQPFTGILTPLTLTEQLEAGGIAEASGASLRILRSSAIQPQTGDIIVDANDRSYRVTTKHTAEWDPEFRFILTSPNE